MQPFQENNKLVPFQKFQSELLSRKEAATYLGVTEQTLSVWKCTQRYDLPVVKIGRLVKYKKSELDKFIERRTVGRASNL
jgi:excisionase family DNA binding protein